MKKSGSTLTFSPSDLTKFMENPYITWMDRLRLEFPDRLSPDDDNEELKIVQERGEAHEEAYLETLRQGGLDVSEIPRQKDSQTLTFEAIQTGRDVIYQAAIAAGRFSGYADFLKKLPIPSKLGPFSYEVWDTKLARKPKPYFIIQLCCYADILESIQGMRPGEIAVVLGDNTTKRFRTDDFFYYYSQLKTDFLTQQDQFDPDKPPEPKSEGNNGRWESVARQWIIDNDHLSQVAGISTVHTQRLQNAGIQTVGALVSSTDSHIPKMLPGTFHKLREQARLQLASSGSTPPKFEVIPPSMSEGRLGLAALPPASPLDVAFDIEGYPHVEGGLEYLFGVSFEQDGTLAYLDWWAHDEPQEKRAFEEFIDWVHALWKQDPNMHVYHYAPYEITAARRLMGKYATREEVVDDLLRNGVFVDLYRVVRQGLRIGTPSYSLKAIEPLYLEKRTTDIATGGESIVFYHRWLELQDGDSCTTSKIISEIRDYNRDDCDSTWKLCDWLRNAQSDSGIDYQQTRESDEQTTSEDRVVSHELASRLLDEIPHDRSTDPERWRIQELIAWMIEFHRRENKPMWWFMFDRHSMTADQLYDDIHCLAGLSRTERPTEDIKRSKLFEYRFDPNQDTKLHKGETCYVAHDLDIKVPIHNLDAEAGLVELKIGPKPLAKLCGPSGAPPTKLDLIPDEFVTSKPIEASIFRIATEYSKTGRLPQALDDFLHRRLPRIADFGGGPILDTSEESLEGTSRVISNLQGTTLCIQGPPGSGKTFTGASTILDLLDDNKRVGVSANSHKAICKIMTEVAKFAAKRNIDLCAVKLGGDSQDPIFAYEGIEWARNVKDVDSAHRLIGGTAWAFSAESAVGLIDYLFVDEAGQVSVANLMGMSPSTRNIVLLGDQMQLGQPTQGSHPGESGLSTLGYLLEDKPTIPDELGIFLSKTWRLHPSICAFISEAVYEGRLQPREENVNRKLILNGDVDGLREAGILFVPVEHEGNSQSSPEEADVIRQITQELLAGHHTDEAGIDIGPLNSKDLLIVAPYNMQVRSLQRVLGPQARVGTVDKFQGQEAPVVILSMCSSAGDASPRGIEFLLDKNRLNVAISRAQSLAIVVGHPALASTPCSTVEQMRLVNMYCRLPGLTTEAS